MGTAIRFSGMSKRAGPEARLERLVSNPVGAYEADCELLGKLGRLAWLKGIGRGLRCSHNGSNWWQRLLIGLLDLESDEWSDAVNVLGRKPRAAGMTASDERAGRFRFTADALARVKEGLCRDDEDPAAAGYAWMLWALSAKSALRIQDLCTAQLDGNRLCDASGDELLGVLSPEARGTCGRLFKVRAVASSGRGEPALYAAAERAWDRAAVELPDNARPLLGSARHLSLAVWRRDLDDMRCGKRMRDKDGWRRCAA